MDKNDFPGAEGEGNGPDSAAQAADAAFAASEDEIGKLRSDLEDASDRVLRAQAELENYRKRARRDLENERKYAALPLLQDLLPVVDDLERAIEAAEKTPQAAGLLDGVKLVAQGLSGALARHDCKKIEALDEPFDPAFHEAISQQPVPDKPPGTVVLVAKEGYVLHDRVVRPAQVIVSKSPEES
ncbi:MAG: nucleotide exchange factor GrpE [Planctomycetota bacterium]|nr:MAG: nucleotide exchange factor GrpE [Planctomycetota bacterium]